MRTKLFSVAALAALLAGCESTGPVIKDINTVGDSKRGAVVLVREAYFNGAAVSATVISSDGHKCGLPNGQAVVIDLPEGEHWVGLKLPLDSGYSSIDVKIEPQKKAWLVTAYGSNAQDWSSALGGIWGTLISDAVLEHPDKEHMRDKDSRFVIYPIDSSNDYLKEGNTFYSCPKS